MVKRESGQMAPTVSPLRFRNCGTRERRKTPVPRNLCSSSAAGLPSSQSPSPLSSPSNHGGMGIKVCGACGSGSNSHSIVKCSRCNDDYEHCYCMKEVAWEPPREWYCAKCQEYTKGGPKPNQGGQTSKSHLSHSNVVHQISPKSPNRSGNSKVKFIPSEEGAALLSRERQPSVRPRFSVSQPSKASSPPTTKHLSNMNCVSPSRNGTKVQALKQCAEASYSQTKLEDRSYSAMQQRQVHPASPSSMKRPYNNMMSISPGRSDMQAQSLKRGAAARHDQAKIDDNPYFSLRESQLHSASPPHVKQLSNKKCISSNKTTMQVHATKRSVTASHDQAKLDDINRDCEARSGGSMPIIHECRTSEPIKVKTVSLIEYEGPEKKIVNADKGEINSQTQLEPREKGTLCASALDEDTGCKSKMGSLNQNKDVILVMGSTVEYSRRPVPANCWRGCFHVLYAEEKLNLGEFKAYFPSKVSSKVNDIVKMMSTDLQLQLLPRMNDWPKSFETINPVHEDIGVFFFPNKPDGCEKVHTDLLESSSNYVLRAYIHDIKLLIYSSEVLPPDSQWIDGENYLWGIFVRPKGKSYPWRSGPTTT